MSAQTPEELEQRETGARRPAGPMARLVGGVLLFWSLFQLWFASPLPFLLDFAILNETRARSLHLALAVFLAFILFPARRRSPRERVPIADIALALAAAFAAGYLLVFYTQLADRAGAPTTPDLVAAGVGLLLLLEATRRALGPPLMVVALVFLGYSLAGPYMPDVIAHQGASLAKLFSHQWLGTEGVFGVALGVSTSFVFLFVLFGALLDQAGAGQYFIRVAQAGLGHLRGGPAKAAVVASGMSGLVSGSSIANVVTTGTFTIPLMKRVGFPAHKAGAVEVAASTNGQLTPPIMGAAAFLMVEYVGISYLEVIKAALLPAVIAYIGLLYIVHLEAVKLGIRGEDRPRRSLPRALLGALFAFLALVILSAVVYYGIGWTRTLFGVTASWVLAGVSVAAYVALLGYGVRCAERRGGSEPRGLWAAAREGLHFLLPVVVLVWCLVVERLSPALSAFWASLLMLFIVATQPLLAGWFRGRSRPAGDLAAGGRDLVAGLQAGARNMIGIAVATAAAGIVVGSVTLTGIGLVMTDFVEVISGGNLFLMLLFTAVISLVLGMGLPTTANYIVVSTLMAPVIVTLGAEQGLTVPLIAVHLFVFYYGILADDTPPVGLAAFAGAAIARSDPIRTGIQGFTYDLRMAVLPFLFIFNTDLLLIGVTSWWQAGFTFVVATVAMLLFAAATQGFFLVRNRLWEGAALLLVALTLFHPGLWMDRVFPPTEVLAPERIVDLAASRPADARLKVRAEGQTLAGEQVRRTVSLPLGPAASDGRERLANQGLALRIENDAVIVDNVIYGSAAQRAGLDFDWRITGVVVERETPARAWAYGPALALLGLVVLAQRRRREVSPHVQAHPGGPGRHPSR